MIQIPPTTVQAKNLPGTSISSSVDAEILGGPQVRFLEMIGKTQESIGDFMLARQDQIDMTTVMNAESEWAIAEDAKLTELLSRKGENAFDLLGEAEQWFDGYGVDPTQDKPGKSGQPSMGAAPGQISAGFREKRYNNMNERQQQYFDMAKNKRKAAFLRSVGTHENKERLDSLIKSADSAIASHVASAIRNYKTPERMEENKKQIENTLKAKAAAAGLSAEELEREREVAKAIIHDGVLTQYLAENDHVGAETYRRKYEDELEGKSAPMIKKAIEAKRIVVEGMKLADEVMKQPPGERQALLNREQDLEVKKEAYSNIYRINNMDKDAKASARKASLKSIYEQMFAKDKAGNYTMLDLSGVTGTKEWGNLEAGDWASIKAMFKARDEEWPAVNPRDNADQLNKLYRMDKTVLDGMHLPTAMWNDGKPLLDKASLNTMIAYQERLREIGEDPGFAEIRRDVENKMDGFGWGPGYEVHRSKWSAKAYDLYFKYLENNNNKKPNHKQWQDELNTISTSAKETIEKNTLPPRVEKLPSGKGNVDSIVGDYVDSMSDFPVGTTMDEKKRKMLKSQTKTAITVAREAYIKKHGSPPSLPELHKMIAKAHNDVAVDVDGANEYRPTGSIPLGSADRKRFTVEVGNTGVFFNDRISLHDIDVWIKANPELAASIGEDLAANGQEDTAANFATEMQAVKDRLKSTEELTKGHIERIKAAESMPSETGTKQTRLKKEEDKLLKQQAQNKKDLEALAKEKEDYRQAKKKLDEDTIAANNALVLEQEKLEQANALQREQLKKLEAENKKLKNSAVKKNTKKKLDKIKKNIEKTETGGKLTQKKAQARLDAIMKKQNEAIEKGETGIKSEPIKSGKPVKKTRSPSFRKFDNDQLSNLFDDVVGGVNKDYSVQQIEDEFEARGLKTW